MRDLTLAMVDALQQDVIYPAILVDLDFADDTQHVWNGVGELAWNGNTYIGVGAFGGVSGLTETTALEAKGATLTLSGISSDLLTESMDEIEAFHDCNIYLCLFDGPCGNILSTPFLSWSGFMDDPEISDDGKTASIAIQVENKLLTMNIDCARRFTADDNTIDLADRLTTLGLPTTTSDTAFQFVNAMQLQQVWWGTSPTSTND
jgi:hypothetical protein